MSDLRESLIRHGMPPSGVDAFCREWQGERIYVPLVDRTRMPVEERAQRVARMRCDGVPASIIAEREGICFQMVYKILGLLN